MAWPFGKINVILADSIVYCSVTGITKPSSRGCAQKQSLAARGVSICQRKESGLYAVNPRNKLETQLLPKCKVSKDLLSNRQSRMGNFTHPTYQNGA